MQSLPQEHTESCPVTTSTPETLPDAEAQPALSQPDAQEKKNKSNTAEETTAGQTGAQAAETPANMAVTPPVDSEPGVRSQSETRDKTASVPTEPVPDPKANLGRDGHKVKKPDKGVGDGRKYVLSKRAMVDPLKMDMSKPIVMPLTSSELSLQCIECHIIFSDHKSKQRHLKLSHPAEYEQCILRNALFACYVCDRHFTNSTELMAHQKAHTEKKPFKCPLCGQAFKKSSELTAHKKIHFGEHGYACNDCGKPCKTVTLLKYHKRTHTDDRPYVCKECGKRFNMPKALQNHMVSHLPEEAEGHEADTTATPKQKTNDGASPTKYPCPVCKAPFKTPKTRQHHMNTKHKLAPASINPPARLQSKQSLPIITPISVSQPSLLQVEPHGPLQRVDANIDTEQIRKLIESLGNVQKVNQVVILGQVPPHAPPLELQQVSEPTQLVNLNLSPPQIDFIGLKQAESQTVELDPSIDPMEQTIILEPITPDGQLENPIFSDLGSHVAAGGHIELKLIEAEQTERHVGEVMHEIFQQPENIVTPMVCQNEVDDLKENLEQTVILELTPALMPAMELDQTQTEPLNQVASSSLVLNTDQEAPDQTAINEQTDSLPGPPFVPTEQQDLCSSSFAPSDTQPPSESKEDSEMENIGLDQVPKMDKKTCDQAKQDLSEELQMEGKNTLSEVPSAKDEANSQLQTSEFPVNVMSAQELVKVRKRKPARTFFFQGYMHDLMDFQFDAKPAKRQRTKKSHLAVKFGPQNKDKKSKKQKKQTQQHQPVREELMKSKSPAKKLSEKKVQTPKKTGKGKKEKSGGNALSGGDVKLPSTQTPQAQQDKEDACKKKKKKQKVAHSSEHKSAPSPVFKKKKQAKILQKDQPKCAKTGKTKKKLTKEQAEKAEETGSLINQDSLLLLKGHKQPQLKVYKLDPSKASGQTPETSPHDSRTVSHTSKSTDGFTADGKKKGGRTKKNQKALSLLTALKVSHLPPEMKPTKPRTTRKRKAPSNVETEGVITSKHALECKNCGEKFNEVSSFQKHKMSAHVVESPSLTYTNGNIFEGVSGSDLFQLPKEHNKVVRVMKSPMDWDTEPEMALEDRERSVSFPALIPSPSLPIPPQDAEMSTYKDKDGSKTVADKQSYPSLDVQSPCDEMKSREAQPSVMSESSCFASTPTQSSETGEPLASGEDKQEDEDATKNPNAEPKGQGNTEEDFKEDLLLEVDLVTIGEQSERDDPFLLADSIDQNKSNERCSSDSVGTNKHPVQVRNETPEKSLTSQTVSCSTHQVEVKEENEETLVQKRKKVGKGDATRETGHPERDVIAVGDDHQGMELEKEQDECQVVYEKQNVFSDLEITNHGTGTKTQTCNELTAMKTSPPVASLPSIPATLDKSPEKPVVFELASLSTSVEEMMSEGGMQREEENDRESDQSPGNILERFLTSRQRVTADQETERSNQIQALCSTTENEVQVLGGPEIKVEENSSDLLLVTPTCQSPSVQPEHHQSIRSVLVKEESSSVLNSTQDPQGSKRMQWNLEPVGSGNTDIPLIESAETRDCRVSPEFNSNQCIFYPVKEEEREVLLGTSRGRSNPEGSDNPTQAANCDAHDRRSSPADYQETVASGPSEPEVAEFTGRQAASDSEWQHPSDLQDFLLQSSDEEETTEFGLSEPQLDREADILAYFNQYKSSSEQQPNQTSTNLPTSTIQLQAQSVENRTREPINYFSKYFSWDTWVEIATCTNKQSNVPNPVTPKEVARFVGIHIAMGTLKFPSPRLYWEDLTKVPLIAEAVPLTRFLELSHTLRLTSPSKDSTSGDEGSQQQGKTCPSSLRVVSQSKDGQYESDTSNSLEAQTDPLWKVLPLLRRFNAGCQSLKRQSDYAVDQHSLPLVGNNHDNRPSLRCTTLTGLDGFLIHVDLKLDMSDTEDAVEKMVPQGSTVFLCKQELSTPAMLERLLAAGVHGAGKVGGARGHIGDEFVSSDGKLMLRRSYSGFILSTAGNGQRNMASLIESFEKAQVSARFSKELQELYSIPLTASAPTCWPQAVLWYLTDAALVNSWLLYRWDHRTASAPLTYMAFRLEVSKALIRSSGSDTQDSVPPQPQPPSEKTHKASETPSPVLLEESPLPDAAIRYDGSGHWPEQLGEGEGGRCRFGDCQRTSRVLCLKCCVFLCISRNHNCFLNFHNQGSLGKE